MHSFWLTVKINELNINLIFTAVVKEGDALMVRFSFFFCLPLATIRQI